MDSIRDQQDNLHSNMFLLRLYRAPEMDKYYKEFTFQYVSIKTIVPFNNTVKKQEFTFQYVSIKTRKYRSEEVKL